MLELLNRFAASQSHCWVMREKWRVVRVERVRYRLELSQNTRAVPRASSSQDFFVSKMLFGTRRNALSVQLGEGRALGRFLILRIN